MFTELLCLTIYLAEVHDEDAALPSAICRGRVPPKKRLIRLTRYVVLPHKGMNEELFGFSYAHMLIVVAFLVVETIRCLIIAS